MMDETFTEEELQAFVRRDAPEDLASRITDAMKVNPALRAEVAVMRGVLQAVQADLPEGQADELGWRRLEAKIKQDQMVGHAADAPVAQFSGVQPLWRAAAVAFGVIILAQGAYIATTSNFAAPARYQTASAQDALHVLAVSFAPEADMAALTALLRNVQARVVDGPGASGLYRVAFATADAQAEGAAALDASALVQMVATE